jgi:hypothetical protein
VKKFLVALAMLVALPAAAQSPVITSKESPRWGSFQFSLSPFSPDIDSEFGTLTPYANAFGTGRPLMVQALVSKSAWTTEVGQGGSTSLMIIPIQVQVTYRFDWFYDRWEIPFAPYVRGAIVDYIWSASGQDGTSSWTNPGTGIAYRGSGGTFGWSATLGLALVLDAFDTALSKQMDYDVGINRTMLFFDFTKSSVNDFGSPNSWQLAPAYWAWSAGLLFVF